MQVYMGEFNPETGKYKVIVGERIISKEIRKAMSSLMQAKKVEQEQEVGISL